MFFTTEPTSKLGHDGKSVGVITQGDTQTAINEKLAAEIEKIRESKTIITTKDTTAEDVMLTTAIGNTSAYAEYPEKYALKVTPKQNTIDVAYDISSVIGNSTLKTAKITVEGKRNGSDAILVSSDKKTSGFSLSPDNFPASLSIEVKVNDGAKDILLQAKTQLRAEGMDGLYTVTVKDFNKANLKTQGDVNTYFEGKIAGLEKSVSNSVILANKTYSIQDAIALLYSEIQDLKNANINTTNVTYKVGESNVTKTLSQALEDLANSI